MDAVVQPVDACCDRVCLSGATCCGATAEGPRVVCVCLACQCIWHCLIEGATRCGCPIRALVYGI